MIYFKKMRDMYTDKLVTEKIDVNLRQDHKSNHQTYEIKRTTGDIYSINLLFMTQLETITLTGQPETTA